MTNKEKLDELAEKIHQAKRDLQWAKKELEKQPKNSKLILQFNGHENALEIANQGYKDLEDEITESNYKLDDEWFDPN